MNRTPSGNKHKSLPAKRRLGHECYIMALRCERDTEPMRLKAYEGPWEFVSG
jgi:hypothetical protein